MGLTPPLLTRSPTFPPDTIQPTGASPAYFHSPVLPQQSFNTSQASAVRVPCSMATHQLGVNDPHATTSSLPGARVVEEWPLATMTAVVNPAAPTPNMMSVKYDPLTYVAPAHGPYGQDYAHPLNSHSLGSPVSPQTGSGTITRQSQHVPPRTPTSAQGGSAPRNGIQEYPTYDSAESSRPPARSDFDDDPTKYQDIRQQAHTNKPQPHPKPQTTLATWTRASTQQYAEPLPAANTGMDLHRQARQGKGTVPRKNARRLTTQEEANFQCEVKGCGKLFSRSYNYKAHMETHDEQREYPFPCSVEGCDKRFVRKTDLQRHHQSVHTKERNYGCDYCGRLFSRKDTLRRHMDDGCSRRFELSTLGLPSGPRSAADVSRQTCEEIGGPGQSSMSRTRTPPPPLSLPLAATGNFQVTLRHSPLDSLDAAGLHEERDWRR